MMNKELFKAAVNDIKIDEEFKIKLSEKMKEKPNKPKNLINYRFMAVSAAALILVAVFVQSKFGFLPDKRIATLSPEKSITLTQGKGTIYINKSEGIRSAKILIPADAYSKDYSLGQLQEVFGRNPLPDIPEGFQSTSDTTSITYDSKGKILFMNALIYSKDINNTEAPSIRINLNKDALPLKDCIYASQPMESTIGNTKVIIGATTLEEKYDSAGKPTSFYDLYSAEFIYNGVGYSIITERTDGQTMIDLLKSIIK